MAAIQYGPLRGVGALEMETLAGMSLHDVVQQAIELRQKSEGVENLVFIFGVGSDASQIWVGDQHNTVAEVLSDSNEYNHTNFSLGAMSVEDLLKGPGAVSRADDGYSFDPA